MKLCICLRLAFFLNVFGYKTVGMDACGKSGVCACYNATGGFLVNCSGRKLYNVPAGIPSNVTVLYLSRNHLEKITRSDLHNMPIVTTLEFDMNNINTIEEDCLSNSLMLRNFTISHNNLTEVNGSLFKNNLCLEKTDLSFNSLRSIPHAIFASNVNLQKIYLNHNQIKDLPSDIFENNPHLYQVDMSSNRLTYIPDDLFENNGRLEMVFLSVNNMKRISQHQFLHNLRLRKLVLSNNALESIPENSFYHLNNLQVLDLSSNKLKLINATLTANNVKLKQLYLNHNKIKQLPEAFLEHNAELENIQFSCNNIEHLPDNIFRYNVKLKQVTIYKNHLTEVNGSLFKNMLYLEKTDLSFNSLRSIPHDIFASNVNVQKIQLTRNQIKDLPSDIFENNPHLYQIDVSNNKLTYVPDNLFENNGRLEILALSGNNLKRISQYHFLHNRSLRKLTLSNNALESIQENSFYHLDDLQQLDLSTNKLKLVSTNLTANNVKLKQLYLNANEIEQLPEAFLLHNRELETVQLSRNKIKHLPVNIFRYNVKLKQLFLSSNDLMEIPRHVFDNLGQLEKLDLSINRLRNVPISFTAKNVNLKLLSLSQNLLKQLPEELFSNNTELQTLKLSHNRIRYLPGNIFARNVKLLNVSLSRNQIENVPEEVFRNNTNLKSIDLSFNKLESIPQNMIKNNRKLQSLKLGSNKLSKLPDDFLAYKASQKSLSICNNVIVSLTSATLRGLSHLTYLSAYGNRLSVLPVDLFSNVTLDYIVFLSNNQLKEIPDGLFCSRICSHGVQWLFLQKNMLTTLTRNTFKGLKNLMHIFLNNNNIQVLEEDSFSGKGFRYIYMFSNNLTRVSNKSFIGENINEIQLYKNNIQVIYDGVLASMARRVSLFVDCNAFEKFPRIGQNMTVFCVKRSSPPGVTLNVRLKESIRLSLIEDGFSCTQSSISTKCRPCRPGTIGDGTKGCISCPKGGYYQDDFGSLECKKCKNGTYVRNPGGKSLEECEMCPGGTDLSTFAGHRACFCKMSYTRNKLFGPCFPCLENGLNCSQDYKFLTAGHYWNWSFPGANLTAYKYFVLQLRNDSNYYNVTISEYTFRIPKVYKCPRGPSCVNKDSFRAEEIEGNCEEGYRGWLCTKCQNKYYSILNMCLRCPEVVWIIFETICILCICVALYIFILLQNNKTQNHKNKERSLYDKISSQLKIVLGFYQVVGELFESLQDVNWTGPLQFVGEIISLMKVNILRVIIRPHCYYEQFKIDVKLQLIIGLCFPVTLIVFLLSVYNVWKLYLKYRLRDDLSRQIHKLKKMRERFLTYTLLLLFITYPPTCDVIFKLYPGACKTFYLYDNATTVNITLLRSDFDLDCKTLKSYQLLAYIATGVYVASFPCVLLALLRKYCKKATIFAYTDTLSENDERRPLTTIDENSCTINENCIYSSIPVWIKFMCENYKPQFWYWEIIELARKVTQTVLVTLLGWEDALTKLLTIGISVLFLTLHAKLSPMTSRFEQRLQMFSLSAIFINVLIASVPTPENYKATLSTVLVVMNMVIILIIAGEVMLYVARFLKGKFSRPHKT